MLEDFFFTVANLKKIQRKGWKEKLNLANPESVADHSYSMTVMAMALSELFNLDVQKTIKMALLHDLAESKTGDFTPDEITKENKLELETNALKQIFTTLPENIANNYLKIWQEFQLQETLESKLVHDIDKLEMIVQAKMYINDGHSNEKFETFFKMKFGINTPVPDVLNAFVEECKNSKCKAYQRYARYALM